MNKKTGFIMLLLPMFMGGIIYYIFCPEVIFVGFIDKCTNNWIRHFVQTLGLSRIPISKTFIRNYLMDALWGYALFATLKLILDNYMTSLIIAIIFAIGLETLQLSFLAKGTFDIWDIIVEIISEVIAMLIIYYYNRRKLND